MTHAISQPARWCLLCAAVTWAGVLAGLRSPAVAMLLILVAVVVAVLRTRTLTVVLAGFVAAGAFSGLAGAARHNAVEHAWVPEGHVEMEGRIVEEASDQAYGRAVLEPSTVDGMPWDGPRIAVSGLDRAVTVGAVIVAEGELRSRFARVRDELVAGVFRVDEVVSVTDSSNPIIRVGNAARDRVNAVYGGDHPTDGLVRGLLIGDTDLLTASDEENLRRAGLAHFVAVSGSNVAMFLVAWWFVTGPIAVHPRIRVIVGMLGLAVFAVITRWEPSVIRASAMAAIPLLGGLVGIPFDPWMALGTAVASLLLVSGHLAMSVGFQLSVAATAGVLIGIANVKDRTPRWLFMPLYATIGAQVAVAPIILTVFGVIPLLAPLANLVAGPLVAWTTAIGGVALVLPVLSPLVDWGASGVLEIGRVAASGPQLGALAALGTGLIGVSIVLRGSRPLGIAASVVIVLGFLGSPPSWPSEPSMVVLDVGQGDAILLQDPSGSVVLIDGGPDPRVLDRSLRRNGVSELSLVVLTHGDLDHAGGLVELLAAGRAEEFWIPRHSQEQGLISDTVDAALRGGATVRRVGPGQTFTTSSIRVDVIAPSRRYLSDNDGSVVLWITAGRTVLLAGDAEAVAQTDLSGLRPQVMVVPHHGSRTTDLDWLAETVGSVAVLSYGENRYGHPHADVLEVLHASGGAVHHTHLEGDVVINLARVP